MTTIRSERSNAARNERGSAEDRRRRKKWLVETYPADRWLRRDGLGQMDTVLPGSTCGVPSTRCFRCGLLLTVETVTPDRIKPGCEGGTYRRENLRPACGPCNTVTGAQLGAARRQKRKKK